MGWGGGVIYGGLYLETKLLTIVKMRGVCRLSVSAVIIMMGFFIREKRKVARTLLSFF